MPTVTTNMQIHNICTMQTRTYVTKPCGIQKICVRDIMLVDTDGKATLINIYTNNEAELALVETN